MTRTSTSRAVGAALALVIGSAAGLSAQTTPTSPSTTPGASPSSSGTAGSTNPDSSNAGVSGGVTGSATGSVGGTAGTAAPVTGSANGTLSRPVPGTTSGSTMQGSTGGMNMQGNMQGAGSSSTSGSSSVSGSGTMSGMQDQPPTSRRRRSSGTAVRKDASGSGMGVTKDVAPEPAPEPAPAPVVAEPAPLPPPPPAPEPVPAPAPEVTTTTTTTTIPVAQGRKLGNGFYFGLQGGANFPQNNLRSAYNTGFNGGVQLGYDPETSPIGLRVNALYNRFRGDNNNSLAVQPNRATDSETYSAFADAVLRLPFGKLLGATSGFYLVGGPGVTLFRNFRDFQQQTGVAVGASTNQNVGGNNSTRFSVNGGAGLEYGIGSVSLFTEGRYVRTFTQGRDTDYVPVTFGLRFHR